MYLCLLKFPLTALMRQTESRFAHTDNDIFLFKITDRTVRNLSNVIYVNKMTETFVYGTFILALYFSFAVQAQVGTHNLSDLAVQVQISELLTFQVKSS